MGHYRRQLFPMDHAGLPLKTVLEQIDILAEDVVPVLHPEAELRRPADVPASPPTHAEMVAKARAAGQVHEQKVAAADHRTGRTPEDDVDAVLAPQLTHPHPHPTRCVRGK